LTSRFIPYSRQHIDEEDIAAVVEVLRSDFLTTGPKIPEFERAVADFVGCAHAVAVSSGTAGLHAAMDGLGIGEGDEVIVPPVTFAATANCVVYMGAKPVFADVKADTLLINIEDVERKITEKTKAIIAVDYAGQPCDYNRLRKIAEHHSLTLVSDSCHALGAEYNGRKCGSLADLTVFSFHAVKTMTTGEGGMVTTDDPELAEKLRRFRAHGISADHVTRSEQGTWYYEMVDLGFNYRITDFQCALGISQLKKLPMFQKRRVEIASRYDRAFRAMSGIEPLAVAADINHAYHLYVIRIREDECGMNRAQVFKKMRDAEIGVNVHYIPVHLHPYYRERFGTGPGMCPVAEKAYEQVLSLPIHASMTKADVDLVIRSVSETLIA